MRVLVACEFSGKVRDAFTALGHDATSADLMPSETQGQHYQGDVRDILDQDWDLMVAHPPCQYLSNSGAHWLHRQEGRWEKMREGAEFFRDLWEADIEHIAIENPIMHKYSKEIIGRGELVKQSQIVQPYWFGHDASKATGLWLKNLPLLTPTNMLVKDRYANQTPSGQNKLGPSPDRWKLRSATYQGLADAMAQQWSTYIEDKENRKTEVNNGD
mgnify:CR=1 FL=1